VRSIDVDGRRRCSARNRATDRGDSAVAGLRQRCGRRARPREIERRLIHNRLEVALGRDAVVRALNLPDVDRVSHHLPEALWQQRQALPASQSRCGRACDHFLFRVPPASPGPRMLDSPAPRDRGRERDSCPTTSERSSIRAVPGTSIVRVSPSTVEATTRTLPG
jgi:hypothetical protein